MKSFPISIIFLTGDVARSSVYVDKLAELYNFRFSDHDRTRKVGEKELMYFYLDLYAGERGHEQGDGI